MITIKVGLASCGIAAGSKEVYDTFLSKLNFNSRYELKKVGCIGCCYEEPIVEIKVENNESLILKKVVVEDVERIISFCETQDFSLIKDKVLAKRRDGNVVYELDYLEDLPFFKDQTKRVSALCGIIDPENIWDYIKRGGYEAFKKALTMDRKEIIELVKASGLRGRGGAGFPTGRKWELMQDADEKYLICNFDEGDPGAFMNRVLVESNPHQVIEGILIASHALKVTKAYIYTRAEYPLAVSRLRTALKQAKELGFFGENGYLPIDIELRLGAGAYVCGEETALIASIEGNYGRPKQRPPFPAQKGLFGKPTTINNVETLANLPLILRNGVDWFRQLGTSTSPGTKMYSLAGGVPRTGYIEYPLGTPLGKILECTGVDLKEIKGVQLGGPSGGCINVEKHLDLPIDYDHVSQVDAIMGSGSFIVIPKSQDMVELARYFLQFSISESCGQCVPCREGTMRMKEILDKILQGDGTIKDLLTLEELSFAVRETSLCGLGKVAPNPVISTMKHFREDYVKHFTISNLDSPTEVYYISPEKCNGCNLCVSVCIANCIAGRLSEVHVINQHLCKRCGLCQKACPTHAIEIKELSEIVNE